MANVNLMHSPIAAGFDIARKEFLSNFSEKDQEAFVKFTSIDDVYDATDELQKKQAQTQTLQNLRKIQPYIECLNQYSGVVETIVQIKPDFLAIIWAPLKMLLVWSSTYMKSFTKVLDSLAQIGAALPQFKAFAQLFRQYTPVQRILELFFRDILDFHLTALKFFKLKHWRVLFESLWPKYSSKFQVILTSISYHRNLMDGEVTLAHITEAHSARISAEERHEKDQERDERMEFQLIQNSIRPHFYDSDLERLRQHCSVQAGDWLENDDVFATWQDVNDQSVPVFWLTGIPGAGKTFLSSIVVNKLQSRLDQQNVAFAFLNYRSAQEKITQIVLHSFLFQLVTDNKDLRPVLAYHHENNYRKLVSSHAFIQDVISSILGHLSTTYFVVDGLDEIVETERSVLLWSLKSLQAKSPNLKLFISSRAEYDISTIIGPQCHKICVHHHNFKDIAEYVLKRVEVWLTGLRLAPEIVSDIQSCTEEIASKSKGMFLYARLVCDSLGRLSNLEDIKVEVNNLPQGLKEAYGRILERIDRDLTPLERTQAKAILEWVSCSIVPVRVTEIQFALSVVNDKDPFQGCRESLLDVVRRCGPILEVVNEHIYFVHFSAREFLFSPESSQYLGKAESNAAIATTCLKYLCSDCFEPTLSDEQVVGGIMRGAFALQEYISSYWLDHVIQACSHDVSSQILQETTKATEMMISLRKNRDFVPPQNRHRINYSLDIFSAQSVELSEHMLQICSFAQQKRRECSITSVEDWSNQDPLIISSTQARFYRLFELLLCRTPEHYDDCKCATVKDLYGPRPFKCTRFGCHFFRSGFDSAKDRDLHLNSHSRPYRCEKPNCEFAQMGFSSQKRLNSHLQRHQADDLILQPTQTEMHDRNDMELFLLDAVEADNLTVIRDAAADVAQFPEQLIRKAVQSASLKMLKSLLRAWGDWRPENLNVLPWAVEADNLEATQTLLERGFSVQQVKDEYACMSHAMLNCSPDMIEILLPYKPKDTSGSTREKNLCAMIPREINPNLETRVIRCLDLLRNWPRNRSEFQKCLKINAERGCSIAIAKYLLTSGVDVNYLGAGSLPHAGTALYIASGRKDRPGADLMKFLLESGADPTKIPSRSRVPMSDRPGPANISERFGISWEQLVEESQKVYAASQQTASSSSDGSRGESQETLP